MWNLSTICHYVRCDALRSKGLSELTFVQPLKRMPPSPALPKKTSLELSASSKIETRSYGS